MSLSKKHKTTKIKTKSKKDNKISNIQKKKKVKDIRIDKILLILTVMFMVTINYSYLFVKM